MADKPFQSITIPELNNTYVNIPPSTAFNFDSSTAYAVNDIVFYNRKLYKFVANHAAGAWNNSHVEEITIGNEIKQIENDLNNKYEKPASGIPASDLASGVIPDVTGKVDKVQNATNGNFASLDANGNLADSGHKHSDYLTEAPVTDVQVNGTSVLGQDGVANVPLASDANIGVIKTENGGYYGLNVNSAGRLAIVPALPAQMKSGTGVFRPVVSSEEHTATFYGLAKAAGDTTQSSSSNAVGTYTETAQSKIHEMLDAPVTVSGTTPTITGKAGIRYICGEVSTLSITPPASGIIDVIFISGSTPTVLTVPNTVKFPEWFDSTSLVANTTYEINIADGVYGAVMTWT